MRTTKVLLATSIALLAAAVPAVAIPTDQAYPVPVQSNGTARAVAASNGTAAWLSQEQRLGSRGGFSIHILKPGETEATKVAVKSDDSLSELEIETTADGKVTAVAVARNSESPGANFTKVAPGDIVAIDTESGAVTRVKGASSAKADERAPALADGTLSFAVKPGQKAKTRLKQMPVAGGRATTFATLSARTLVEDLTTYPDSKKLGLNFDTYGKKKVRYAIATVTKGGKPKIIKAQTIGLKELDSLSGPFVTEEGETLFATGVGETNLYRADGKEPVRTLAPLWGAAWVGGELGLLAITVPATAGESNLGGTGPLK